MGIGTSVEAAIDLILADYVSAQVADLSAALSPLATSLLTIYILFTAKALLVGDAHNVGSELFARLIRVVLAVGLALQVGNYQEHIVQASADLEGGIIRSLSGAASVGGLVDDLSRPYEVLGNRLWSEAVTGFWPNFALLAAAGGVAIIQCALFIVGLGLYLLAKVGFALMLALGPIFILCGMSSATQKYTENWLAQVLNFIVLKVLVATSIQMLTDFTSTFAAHIDAEMDAVNVLKAVISLFCCGGALLVVMLNLPHMATALTGGATLAGIGRTIVNAMMFRGRGAARKPPRPPQSGGSLRPTAAGSGPSPANQTRTPLYQRNTLDRLQPKPQR